eukprot:scaffold5047_cov54-Cyclotella_meneghiniana.AAC.1
MLLVGTTTTVHKYHVLGIDTPPFGGMSVGHKSILENREQCQKGEKNIRISTVCPFKFASQEVTQGGEKIEREKDDRHHNL